MIRWDDDAIADAVHGRWLTRPAPAPPGAAVTIDSRAIEPGALFVALRGTRVDGHDYLGAAAAHGARAVMIDDAARAADAPAPCGVLLVTNARAALGRLGAWHRAQLTTTTVVGITGSCGKTTTRRLIDGGLGSALTGTSAERSFNNDLGVPLTLCRATPADAYLLVEIGTNAPGEIAHLTTLAAPRIAVLTGVAEAHLEGFGTIDGVIAEKTALLRGLGADGLAVVADDPRLDAACAALPHVVRCGERATSDVRLVEWNAETRRLTLADGASFTLALAGRHNAHNALAAIAVGRWFGLTDDVIARGLAAVPPDAMRLTPQERDGVTFINDAYNANPASMRAGLETFGDLSRDAARRVLVLGDMLELGRAAPALHEAVGRAIDALDRRTRIDHVVYVGRYGDDVRRGAERVAARIEILAADDDAFIARAQRGLQRGDAVFVKGSRGLALERIIETPCSTTC